MTRRRKRDTRSSFQSRLKHLLRRNFRCRPRLPVSVSFYYNHLSLNNIDHHIERTLSAPGYAFPSSSKQPVTSLPVRTSSSANRSPEGVRRGQGLCFAHISTSYTLVDDLRAQSLVLVELTSPRVLEGAQIADAKVSRTRVLGVRYPRLRTVVTRCCSVRNDPH